MRNMSWKKSLIAAIFSITILLTITPVVSSTGQLTVQITWPREGGLYINNQYIGILDPFFPVARIVGSITVTVLASNEGCVDLYVIHNDVETRIDRKQTGQPYEWTLDTYDELPLGTSNIKVIAWQNGDGSGLYTEHIINVNKVIKSEKQVLPSSYAEIMAMTLQTQSGSYITMEQIATNGLITIKEYETILYHFSANQNQATSN